MSQSMPTHGFKWLSSEEIMMKNTTDVILNLPDDAPDGYIFEVDLEYPEEIHNLHNDYPLAPEYLTVDANMLSPFQKDNFPAIKRRTS